MHNNSKFPLTVSACPPWPCLCFFGSFIKFSSGIRSRIFFCLLPVFLLLFSQEENFIVNFRIMHNNNTTTDGSWEKKQQPFAASDYLRHFVARKLRWVPQCRIAKGMRPRTPTSGPLVPQTLIVVTGAVRCSSLFLAHNRSRRAPKEINISRRIANLIFNFAAHNIKKLPMFFASVCQNEQPR